MATLSKDFDGTIRFLGTDHCCCCLQMFADAAGSAPFPDSGDYLYWYGPDGICGTEDDVPYGGVTQCFATRPATQDVGAAVSLCGAVVKGNLTISYHSATHDDSYSPGGLVTTPTVIGYTFSNVPYENWTVTFTFDKCDDGDPLTLSKSGVTYPACINNAGAGGGACTSTPPP